MKIENEININCFCLYDALNCYKVHTFPKAIEEKLDALIDELEELMFLNLSNLDNYDIVDQKFICVNTYKKN